MRLIDGWETQRIYNTFDEQSTASPKKGKWINLHGIIHCGECGGATGVPTCYCPNCGADMREDY